MCPQVVSPASSETSDLEVRGHGEGVKKSVTFTSGTTVISTPELSDSDTLTSATEGDARLSNEMFYLV